MTQHNSVVSKYARHFFSGTLVSRISGMARDMSMAALFGDHPSVAAFMIAFRFSHFLRRLLSEGTMQSIFIPHYEELRLKDASQANGFFFRLYVLLISLLLSIVLLVEIPLSYNGFTLFACEREIVYLFAWMFPGLVFISLYGLNISLLQCRDSFFTSSVAPFACNLIWILGVFIFAKQAPMKAMVNVSIFVLIGFFIQWFITMPKTWKVLKEGRRCYTPPLFSIPVEIRTIGKATFFGMIGVTAVQINSFLDMLFARYADVKGPIYLWYAIRLEQLPLALIGFACVYSIVPSLSRLIKSQELQQAQELFFFGSKRIFLLVMPCTFALFALGLPSINLLFGHGHFSSFAVIQTTLCLWAYGLSLLPSTLTVYESSLFYAFGDFKTPTIASLISVAANILFNAVFIFYLHWGAISIALSTSFSSCLNYWILKKAFLQKDYFPLTHPKISLFWKLFAVSSTASACCIGIDFFLLKTFQMPPRTFSEQTLHLFGQLALFIVLFILGLFLLDKQTLFTIKNLILAKDKQLSVD